MQAPSTKHQAPSTAISSRSGRHAIFRTGRLAPGQTAVLRRVEYLAKNSINPVVVVDVDDTIYDSGSREARIFHEAATHFARPELRRATSAHFVNWDKPAVLRTLGVPEGWISEQFPTFKRFWADRFFTSAYVLYDTPIPYAASYLQRLHTAGAHILYLTGRDETNMRAGTEQVLMRDTFPWNTSHSTLICKPSSSAAIATAATSEAARILATVSADAQFKANARSRAITLGTVIGSFDNEPANVRGNFETFHAGGVGVAIHINTRVAIPETLVPGAVSIFGFREHQRRST